MRRRHVVCLLVVGLLVLMPSPALAWWGDGWLEKLSGPGPFRGKVYDVRFLCFAEPQPPDLQGSARSTQGDSALGYKLTFPDEPNGHRFWLAPLGCHFLNRDTPRLEFGFEFERLSAEPGDNKLDYTGRPELTLADKGIDLHLNLVTADVRVNKVLDVGAAIGYATFNAGAFEQFRKVVIRPVRVTVRPFSPLAKASTFWGSWADVISIRFEGTKFNGGFRAEEFGARPGTYDEPGEIVWSYSALLDLSPLFWGKRR